MNVGWIKIARHRYVRHTNTNIIKNEAKVVKPLMKRFDIVLIKLQITRLRKSKIVKTILFTNFIKK